MVCTSTVWNSSIRKSAQNTTILLLAGKLLAVVGHHLVSNVQEIVCFTTLYRTTHVSNYSATLCYWFDNLLARAIVSEWSHPLFGHWIRSDVKIGIWNLSGYHKDLVEWSDHPKSNFFFGCIETMRHDASTFGMMHTPHLHAIYFFPLFFKDETRKSNQ